MLPDQLPSEDLISKHKNTPSFITQKLSDKIEEAKNQLVLIKKIQNEERGTTDVSAVGISKRQVKQVRRLEKLLQLLIYRI